ncbi:hypothetical protein HN709_00885, partial [Candidatus Peregrinibacteria bacterium]|nr:hypothetical protein [Candidatus Peregrinibacteria bacterium]
ALSKQEGLGRDSIANKAHDFLRSNYSAFTQAVRSKDYATAGMYAVGIWAIYRSLKETGWFKEGGGGMKYIAYGLAAYCGVKFAENAGYDVLKMAGFRDPDYHVQGTPMEAFYNTLRGGNESDKQLAQDVDWQIVTRVSEVNLKDLQKWREDAKGIKGAKKGTGVGFISPHLMPDIFPGLSDEYISIQSLGLGEDSKNDNTGMGGIKLTPAQREYRRVGLQLYKIATMMEVVYNNTLKIDEHPGNPYKDWEYEDAINKGSRDLGKVRHLASAVSKYAPQRTNRKLNSGEVKDRFINEVFAPFPDCGFDLTEQPNQYGHYTGHIKDFPVMFVPDGNKGYRAYLMNNYKGSSNAGREFVKGAIIPFEGSAGSAPGLIIKAVDERMDYLLTPLKDSNGKKMSSLKYGPDGWVCDVKIKGLSSFGLPDQIKKQAHIVPFEKGDGVAVLLDNGVRVNLDELGSQIYPIGTALIPYLVAQKEFHSFQIFNNARSLKIYDVNEADKTFDVQLDSSMPRVKIRRVNGKFKFDNPNDELLMIQDEVFASKYIQALEKDTNLELNNEIDSFSKHVCTAAPQSVVAHFFKTLAGQTKDTPFSGLNLNALTGSIPENFTKMILKTSKMSVYYKIRMAIQKAKTLKEVEDIRTRVLLEFTDKLAGARAYFDKRNAEHLAPGGGDWEAGEFIDEVITPIRLASTNSATYADMRTQMETFAYSRAPGFLKSTDFNEDSHEVVAKIVGVYTYYTSYLDGEPYKYTDSKGASVTKIMNLDTLSWPPSEARMFPAGAFGAGKDYLDPGLRGHYIRNYMHFVKQRLMNKVAGTKNLSALPSPSAAGSWGIPTFEKWLDSPHAKSSAIETIDNRPKLTHDPDLHKKGKHTELDEYMMKQYRLAVRMLALQYPGIIDVTKIEAYLTAGWQDSTGGISDAVKDETGQMDPNKIGFFTVYNEYEYSVNADGDLEAFEKLYPGGGNVKNCGLWEHSDKVFAGAKGMKFSRSVQERLIKERMGEFIKDIMSAVDEDTGEPKFFKEKPGVSDWLTKNFPQAAAWLRSKGFIN